MNVNPYEGLFQPYKKQNLVCVCVCVRVCVIKCVCVYVCVYMP